MRTTCIMGLVLFLLGVSPTAAQDQTLTGWFSFIVVDYPSESGFASEITYVLIEDSGERHELLIDVELMRSLGGPVALNRKRVTVVGEWEQHEPDAPAQFWVHSIERAVLPSSALPGRPFAFDLSPDETAPPWSTLQSTETDSQVRGSLPLVTILCRFADATDVTPHPVSYYEGLIGSSHRNLDHYWREVSYGNINLTGSVVVGWYNLPRPRSYYVYDRDGDGEEDYDLKRLEEDCVAAGDADVFFPDFWGINLVFNQPIGKVAGVGTNSYSLTKDGQEQLYGIMWLSQQKGHRGWAAEHEMAHMLGLLHSSGPYDETYDSEWDVVSRGAGRAHTIAYHKDFLGWIPPARKYVAAPNTTRTITLERLAQPGAEGYLMAQIPLGESDTDFYTVEARLFAGYDKGIPGEAVIIHKVDTTRGDRLAQVVDVDNNGGPNDDGAMWTVGETFTDLARGIQVSIDAKHATGFHVTIDYTDYTICAEVLSPRRLFGGHGGNASVIVRAPSSCSWAATSDSPWITITMGSGRVNYTVAENTSLNARTGTLTIAGRTFTVVQAGLNGNLFEDDMESGTGSWSAPLWALTTAASRSGKHAWTDSPDGNYRAANEWFSLWSPLINLAEFSSATLTFWHRYDFASGDTGYVSVERPEQGWMEEHVHMFTGTNLTWQQISVDLSPFVGETIRIVFQLESDDASETADGWYIDDVAVYSTDFETAEPPPSPQATLENPAPESFQSGIGIISGWACEAGEIIIELAGTPVQAAYGTPRGDTQPVCGDSNNGFSLLVNWNNLGPGEHAIRALADGVEFARTTVRVTTLGAEVLQGVSGTFPLQDFPYPGDTTLVQWSESQQNFVITDGQPSTGGGHNRVAGLQATLENPSLGSPQSGIGIMSGWACEAQEVVIELAGTPVPAAYGTPRDDTQGVCGDSNNGFSLLVNWNNLGPGEHAIRALADGVEFARTTVRVTTLGAEVLRGVSGTYPLPDFPHSGDTTTLRWEESLQNFVIIP